MTRRTSFSSIPAFALATCLVFAVHGPAGAHEANHDAAHAEAHDPAAGGYTRSRTAYALPNVGLRDQAGRRTSLREAVAVDGPLLMNFIFTSCSTICPIMSATFGEVQDELAAIAPGLRMLSISIDPEYDTPRRLREYAALHGARGNWTFLTGDAGEIRRVISAFDAIYRADNKMYHLPYTYMRPARGAPWTRLEGLMSATDLIEEFRAMVAAAEVQAY